MCARSSSVQAVLDVSGWVRACLACIYRAKGSDAMVANITEATAQGSDIVCQSGHMMVASFVVHTHGVTKIYLVCIYAYSMVV